MKLVSITLILLMVGGWVHADDTPENNIYNCRLFQPDSSGGSFTEIQVTPEDQVAVVVLNDQIHRVEIQWWDWILNVQVFKEGQVVEIVGAASHEHLKLRSHAPKVSITCERQ